MKDFLNIDEKIEANQKALEFYYANYQKIQSKLSFLIILYSILSLYLVQILKFPLDKYKEIELPMLLLYLVLLIIFLYFLIGSIYNTFQIIKPEEVSYLNNPNYFYIDIKKQYEELLKTDNQEILNTYLKETYLNELEITLIRNIELYNTKGRYFYNTFIKLLPTLIFYILCSGIVIFNTDEKTDINIKNYKEILTYNNAINSTNKNLIMADEKPKQTPPKETIKIDPSKVIKTLPRAVKESFAKKIDLGTNSKTKKI